MHLNAVLCVWNEEDIIESTVKHLFKQGCANVFIVDNMSTDKTVENAIHAGAILATQFKSKYFDELRKIAYLNTVVKNYNDKIDEEHVWWMYVDADEFPNINADLTILDFVRQLDPSIRAVHGYHYNHIPTHPPYHMSPYHPADFQPICTKTHTSKIPLLRYDKDKPHLYSAGGAHTLDTCDEMIQVAMDVINIHHFLYRRPENTISRLRLLNQKMPDGSRRLDIDDYNAKLMHKSPNTQHVRSMYIERYYSAQDVYNKSLHNILMVDELIYNYAHIVRHKYINEINKFDCSEHDSLLNKAVYYFFIKNYDLSLCNFHDLLKITKDIKQQLLITIKIAACLSFTDKSESLSILKQILKCDDLQIREYCIKQLQKLHGNNVPIHQNIHNIAFNIQQYCGAFDKKIYIDAL